MEQPNNCYYLQWAKWRNILRTIRKGKVGHQAGKKAFKQHQTQRMRISFKCKQFTVSLLQITIPRVLAMCQALDRHCYLSSQINHTRQVFPQSDMWKNQGQRGRKNFSMAGKCGIQIQTCTIQLLYKNLLLFLN